MAKLFYIMRKERSDLKTAISFLCRRVSKSDAEYWGKVRIVLSQVKKTIDYKRIIGSESFTYLYNWIETKLTAHSGMIIHTGGAISMGHGVLQEKYSVKRLNTKYPWRRI